MFFQKGKRAPDRRKAIVVEVSGYEAVGHTVIEGERETRYPITQRYPSVMRNPTVDKRDIPKEERLEAVTRVLTHLRSQDETIACIGLGSTGTVDTTTGVIIRDQCKYYQETSWPKVLLEAQALRPSDRLYVQNDAKAGAWGEYRFWSSHPNAQSCPEPKTFVRVIVGTGVGSAVIHNGSLLAGARFVAGEIPYMPYRPPKEWAQYIPEVECEDGRYGCTESYAAAPGILRGTRKAASQQQSDWARSISDPSRLTLVDVDRGFREGDAGVMGVIEVASAALGSALLNIVYLVGPEVILVGGSVVEQLSQYFGLVEDYVKKHGVISPALDSLTFALTQFPSDDAVALGLADLAINYGRSVEDFV